MSGGAGFEASGCDVTVFMMSVYDECYGQSFACDLSNYIRFD